MKKFLLSIAVFIFFSVGLNPLVEAKNWNLSGYDITFINYHTEEFPAQVTALIFKDERTGSNLTIEGLGKPRAGSICFKAMIYQWCPSFEDGYPKATYFLVNKSYDYFNLDIAPMKCEGRAGALIKYDKCFIRIERRVGTYCYFILGKLPADGTIRLEDKNIITCPVEMVTK